MTQSHIAGHGMTRLPAYCGQIGCLHAGTIPLTLAQRRWGVDAPITTVSARCSGHDVSVRPAFDSRPGLTYTHRP